MSDRPVFLSIEQVLATHERAVVEFGGSLELRDRGLLESAVAMPAATFAGKLLHETPAEMAAAYLFHLCKNHAFADGNKRTALAVAAIFLHVNNLSLAAEDAELERLTLGVAEGSLSKGDVTAFFQARVKLR